MNIDQLRMFKDEDEIRNWSRVNGLDIGATDLMVAKWKSLGDTVVITEGVIAVEGEITYEVADDEVSDEDDEDEYATKS